MEEIKELLDENEDILWQGESDKDALKESYLFWKDLTKVSILPFIILNILIIVYVPFLIINLFIVLEAFVQLLIYMVTFYFVFLMDLVYASRIKSLYKNRKFGSTTYFITSKRIFIGTRDMKDSSKFYEYSSDICCKLSNIDFKSKGMFAYIDEKRVNQIEIHLRGNHYHVYFSYEIEEDDHWRFKMGGLKEISSLSEVLVKKLSFEKLESYMEHVDLYVRE